MVTLSPEEGGIFFIFLLELPLRLLLLLAFEPGNSLVAVRLLLLRERGARPEPRLEEAWL